MKKWVVWVLVILVVFVVGILVMSKVFGKVIQVNQADMCVKCAGKYAYLGGKTGIECSKEPTKMYGSYAMPGKDCGVKKNGATPSVNKKTKRPARPGASSGCDPNKPGPAGYECVEYAGKIGDATRPKHTTGVPK